MKIYIALWAVCLSANVLAQSLLEAQLKYPRVRESRQEAEAQLKALFGSDPYPAKEVFLRLYKEEKELEVWIKSRDTFRLLTVFPICYLSGVAGPKRREGDLQVPEGLYRIDRFNPTSSFYLSMRINYPNLSDRILKSGDRAGGEIYIHGSCASIGCTPIEDHIKALYWLCIQAKQPVEIHCFPAKFTGIHFERLKHEANPEIQKFWKQLAVFDSSFSQRHRIPKYRIDGSGNYIIQN
jgi:murein L,D-transpeptidase YafK